MSGRGETSFRARRAAIAVAGGLLSSCGGIAAQDFSVGLADVYEDITDFSFAESFGLALKGGFQFGVSANATYNSNLFLAERGEESDVLLNLGPWIAYTTDPEGGATFAIDARYAPGYRKFFDHSQLDGLNHDFAASFRVLLPRTTIRTFFGYQKVATSDRLAGSFVEGTILRYGVSGSYQLAPRTSINARISAGSTSFDSGARNGSDIMSASIGAMWDATERWSLGPSLRYSVTESGNTGSREAWAFLGRARYRMNERLNLAASLGIEFVNDSRGGGSSDPRLTGGLTASYLIDERWSWSGSIRYASIPAPSSTNFVADDLTFTTAIHRQLLRGSISAGATYSLTEYDAVGPVVATRDEERNWSVFVGYARPLFSDRVSFNTIARYTSNDGRRDWTQFTLSCGVGVAF
jgi:hypothetical protein